MIETIVCVGVVWNAILQTVWFMHYLKHHENNDGKH